MEKAERLEFTKKFMISNKKILLWNKKTILAGSIDDQIVTSSSLKVNKILLEVAKLSDCLSVDRKRRKRAKVTEDHTNED